MQIYRTLDKGKTMHPGDEEEQEANEMKPDSKLKEKKVRPILWYPRLKNTSGRFWILNTNGRIWIQDFGR